MKKKLTLTERIILEVLSAGAQTFEDLSSHTNLKNEVLLNSLHLLMIKKIIHSDNWSYSLDQDFIKKNIQTLTSYRDNIGELQELVGSAIEYSIENDDQSFKINKSSVPKKDFIVIKGLLNNIEHILSRNKNKPESTDEKYVFYWGYGNYQNIINQAMS